MEGCPASAGDGRIPVLRPGERCRLLDRLWRQPPLAELLPDEDSPKQGHAGKARCNKAEGLRVRYLLLLIVNLLGMLASGFDRTAHLPNISDVAALAPPPFPRSGWSRRLGRCWQRGWLLGQSALQQPPKQFAQRGA